jgi:hypothetical protein
MSVPKTIKCLYHWPCIDGMFAASALYHTMKHSTDNHLSFLPNTTFDPLTVEAVSATDAPSSSTEVFMLDFAGPPGFARNLAQTVTKLTVIDHHKTAAEDLTDPNTITLNPPNMDIYFDMSKSGATLALSTLNPPNITPQIQQLFDYVEDADLWKWKLCNSKAFHAGIKRLFSEQDMDVNKNPGLFEELWKLDLEEVIALGQQVMIEEEKVIQSYVDGASFRVQLGGKEKGKEMGWPCCLAVVLTTHEHAMLRSQIGNKLAKMALEIEEGGRKEAGIAPMGLVVYKEETMAADGDVVKCSLRSIGLCADTTVVSRHYGGGGHLNASSFLLKETEFETHWKL